MTRVVLFFISLILFTHPICVFADEKVSDVTKTHGYREITILAQKGDYNMLSISTPDSGAMASGSYMPFYLTDPYVQYTGNVNQGRHIADWSLATNYTPVKLTIDAAHLKSSSSSGTEIKYILGFYYNYPIVENGEATGNNASGTIVVNSGDTYSSTDDTTCAFNDVLAGGAIIFANAPIRFMLAENQKIDGYPTGTYSAKVTVTIEGE